MPGGETPGEEPTDKPSEGPKEPDPGTESPAPEPEPVDCQDGSTAPTLAECAEQPAPPPPSSEKPSTQPVSTQPSSTQPSGSGGTKQAAPDSLGDEACENEDGEAADEPRDEATDDGPDCSAARKE